MAQTNLMRADEIANGFNGVADRKYWKAGIAGTRTNPEVHFNSRSSMVRIVYRIATDDFTVVFSKTDAAFGDFMASAYKSLGQVMAGLKTAALAFPCVVDDDNALLRVSYDPRSKAVTLSLARKGDDWPDADPASFKVPERNNSENPFAGVDEL